MSLNRRQFVATVAGGALAGQAARAQMDAPAWLAPYREPAALIVRSALADRFAWNRLNELADTFGHRMCGSAALENAIAWIVDQMRADGFDPVKTEPLKVPHWVRGVESLEIVSPQPLRIPMLGLGNSVGTPDEGLEAELLVVSSFAELERRREEALQRIVLFNVPFTDYVSTVVYRTDGANHAAAAGAVAVLVRSVGPPGLRTPHTGAVRYAPNATRIPAAAVAVEDARRLQRMAERGQRVRVRLRMGARTMPDADSANIVADLRGRERPEEIVLVGAHLDSWDVGDGVSDDAGGCVAVWEVARLFQQLDLRPRRTVRVVLFTNEENGLRGAYNYRDVHRDELRDHVLLLETDMGIGAPVGFGVSGNDLVRAQVSAIASLLRPLGATGVQLTGGGADIRPSALVAGIPMISPDVSASDYFVVHHTDADTTDRVAPENMAKHIAALAVMTYVVADMPHRLGSLPEAMLPSQ
jgi:carboxypeptidase Q